MTIVGSSGNRAYALGFLHVDDGTQHACEIWMTGVTNERFRNRGFGLERATKSRLTQKNSGEEVVWLNRLHCKAENEGYSSGDGHKSQLYAKENAGPPKSYGDDPP